MCYNGVNKWFCRVCTAWCQPGWGLLWSLHAWWGQWNLTSTAGRQVVMRILALDSYNGHTGGKRGLGVPLNKIKSHLMLEQLVPERKDNPPLQKNTQNTFQRFALSVGGGLTTCFNVPGGVSGMSQPVETRGRVRQCFWTLPFSPVSTPTSSSPASRHVLKQRCFAPVRADHWWRRAQCGTSGSGETAESDAARCKRERITLCPQQKQQNHFSFTLAVTKDMLAREKEARKKNWVHKLFIFIQYGVILKLKFHFTNDNYTFMESIPTEEKVKHARSTVNMYCFNTMIWRNFAYSKWYCI